MISFEFDEYIKVQGFNSEVYITPKVENIGYEIDKNRLIIEFEEELAPNTTYNIQLGNCVRDITENNKSQGITLAFSTGNQLDSLKLIGKASNYLDGSTLNNQLIGLYDTKDTLNIDNSSPLYYTYTNTSGDFQMKHLKKGTYFVYAIGDKNKNKKYNKGEGIDFIPQEISIENYQDSILDFRIFKESHNPNQITNIRQQENWVLIKTRRGTEKIDAKGCYSVISEDGKSIKLYNQSFEVGKDYSISLNITDSLNRTIDSNFVINYKDFPVKKKDLMTSKSTEMYFTNNLEFSLFFSEPINIDTTKLIIENKGKTYQLSKNDIKLKNGNTILEISKKKNSQILLMFFLMKGFIQSIIHKIHFLIHCYFKSKI
ncbi:MAG: Ig-like domain-containing protein [Cytophagales bacterium]|nr:Ig-like domain-containing protein [Cytophagales bacterium]